jgi:hypothetical protein
MVDRVEALERQVASLNEADFGRFATSFADYEAQLWDEEVERDARDGKKAVICALTRVADRG